MNEAVTPAKTSKLITGATGDWEVVVGMEVHAQVTSKAKLFSGAPTEFGGAPNSHVSFVDAAMPGMLPVINEECIAQAVRTGLGLRAQINLKSRFDRKNYFYPDLPQGYQISQYQQPIVGEGQVTVDLPDGETFTVGIERLHLEQDAGKSIHDQHPTMSYVDLNRSGVALMEIVSKPDIRSAEEARAFLTKLRSILRYLGTSDGDMEKGNLRADVNVSVRRPGEPLGTRCEIKNVNSIRFVGQAIEHEARRQIAIIEDGGTIAQETRLFDPGKGETRSMRTKEEAHDYRYFPDPDLLPLELDADYVAALGKDLPELPDAKKARFVSEFGLSTNDAGVLVAEKEVADYFEQMVRGSVEAKRAANWVINVVLADKPKEQPTKIWTYDSTTHMDVQTFEPWMEVGDTGPIANTEILRMIERNDISTTMGKELRLRVVAKYGPTNDPELVRGVAKEAGFAQITDRDELMRIVDEILAANPDKVAQAQAKPAMLGWFVGQVMKASGGKANPQAVNALLREKLGISE